MIPANGARNGQYTSLFQGIMTFVCPANTTVMIPPQAHINFELLLRAGRLPINTVGDPVIQGGIVTGMQGMGVNTPIAAAVAATTEGFDGEVHAPKGRIFLSGM